MDIPSKTNEQYSLRKIIMIWALSAFPMAFLAFVFTPAMIWSFGTSPILTFWTAMLIGLVWQFILSLLILKHDGHPLTWNTVKERMWYRRPINPRTGKQDNRMFLWTIPFILLNALISSGQIPDLDQWTAPLTRTIPAYDLSQLDPTEWKGAWWAVGLFLVTMVFNYFLGEEFLYRGILLPKMQGAFGRWDWFANGVLFGLYHLHKPAIILSTALYFGFVFAFPSRLFRSNWMALIIHGLEGVLGLFIVLRIVIGKA